MKSIRAWAAVWLAAAFFGCATRNAVLSDYSLELKKSPPGAPAPRTVVLFLVDGLSQETLNLALRTGRLPSVSAHFLSGGSRVATGRAQFPTLTYPNIASILTAAPVGDQPIVGNRMVVEGKAISFESPSTAATLNRLIAPQTVFTALNARHAKSVSLSYFFHGGATAAIEQDLKSGVAYAAHDYEYVDRKLLASLDKLLAETPRERWPELAFVHLIGLDSISHEHGPRSWQAIDYLARLDGMLKPVLERLREGETPGREAVTLLTSDHGFVDVRRTLHLEQALAQLDRKDEVRVLNQGRVASLDFPATWNLVRRAAFLGDLSRLPGLEASALRAGPSVLVNTRGLSVALRTRAAECRTAPYELAVVPVRLSAGATPIAPREARYACPEDFDRAQGQLIYPELAPNLARYFRAPGHPDAILIASDGTSFTEGDLGQHGGPTPAELYVPILARGARIADGRDPFPTYKLLSFLKKVPAEPAHPAAAGSYPAVE